MKVKLTLWMEEATIEFGKRLAARHGTSFSHLVEHILVDLPTADDPESVSRWRENFEKAHPVGGPGMCDLKERMP